MTILRDTSIKMHIASGALVPGGCDDHIDPCAYSFLPGKIFHAGGAGKVVDWNTPAGGEFDIINPGELVWIRTKESVHMPNDICGFWWQTNTLSRRGLMLVNMSMVEPGYKGPLACLFVNFGKDPISIYPNTKIAKMVFMLLDSDTENPFSTTQPIKDYDQNIHQFSIRAPDSFLRVSEIAAQVEKERKDAIDTIKKEAEESKKKILDEISRDIPAHLRRALGWTAAGIILLMVLSSFTPWLQSVIRPDLDEVARRQVERVLTQKMYIAGQPAAGMGASAPATLSPITTPPPPSAPPSMSEEARRKIEDLEARLRKLEVKP